MVKSKEAQTKKRTSSRTSETVFRHVQGAEGYVRDVISGKILACKWVKLACERHRRDLAASKKAAFPFRFDPNKADRVCRFFERLPHTKGKWARKDRLTGERQTIKLEGWQQFILASIFGWIKKKNDRRRFSKARIYVPRKNGKSIFGGGIGLYMLAFDDEPGAEIYSGATSEKQAWEVFGPAREMCKNEPDLAEHAGITVAAQMLFREEDNSKFQPVIGKPGDGSSPHCAITDEYHEHKTSVMLDTMETGMGARDQPLSIVISTAGSDTAGPCREDWKNCENILTAAGGFEDDSTFCIIYTIDEDDEWDSEEALIKANPNWGISIDTDFMLAKLRTAKQRASQQSAYRTKHLNEWMGAKSVYYNTLEWAKLERKITREDYKEFPCYLAADFASHLDLTAVMQLFCLPNGHYALFGKYYLPADTIQKPEKQHYRNWHIAGHLEAAGDAVMDFETIREDILALFTEYKVEEFVVDPTRMWGELPKYEEEGMTVVPLRQVVLTMSQPMKDLEALIMSGKIIHDGDPILAWCIGNVTGAPDRKDNVYPNKENADSKIDAAIATMFALNRAATRPAYSDGSFFAF